MTHAVSVIDREFSRAKLVRDSLSDALPQWYARTAHSAAQWRDAANVVRGDFAGTTWLASLRPAFGGGNRIARLEGVAEQGGVVVTTGQQPGLFGGPLYVIHKALTALELADALQRVTGIPTAPVFWAATDDADFAEANHVSVVARGVLERLEAPLVGTAGLAMTATPVGDVHAQLERLADACGSVADAPALRAAYDAYCARGATVGSAYVVLLRALLEPLGIAVLDAAHSAVRSQGAPLLRSALERAEDIASALAARTREMRAARYAPQVADVPSLSLVFETKPDGTRRRIPIREAAHAARSAAPQWGPNVLLRPIMERAILPTVAYVGGPGEVSYFAQLSAVASVLGAPRPRIVPRWSGTVIEPGVAAMLDELSATVEDFADPHAMESRVAREELPLDVRTALETLRGAVSDATSRLAGRSDMPEPLQRSTRAMRATVERRIARLERRYAATVKRSGSDRLRMVTAVRAALYPNGIAQERVLSFVPLLARYGAAATDAIRAAVRGHAGRLVAGD